MGEIFERVCIVGVGLIGGSLGLALRGRRLVRSVVGVGHRSASIHRALAMGALDSATLRLAEGVKDADLVVLATAVGLIVEMGEQAAADLRPGCIVSDVGSTKSHIVHRLEGALGDAVHFVGAHPIAGSEKRGIDAARADLFEKSVCVLTPTLRTDAEALRRLAELWAAVGAKVATLSPEEHDVVLARTSHVPHLTAGALIGLLAERDALFVGTGLRDTTRVASGDAGLWTDIILTNREAVLKAMESLSEKVSELRRAVQTNDRDKLTSLLDAAARRRDRLWPGGSSNE
jgi:prephenate dehydrogenase